MVRIIPVFLFMAIIFTSGGGYCGGGDKDLSISPAKARRNLADLYCPDMFVFYAQKGNTDMVKLFLAGGMDANVRAGVSGCTALMQAANTGHLDTVKTLIENGADMGLKDKSGETALIKASSMVEDGADVDLATNDKGELTLKKAPPDDVVRGKKEVAKLLTEMGAK